MRYLFLDKGDAKFTGGPLNDNEPSLVSLR